MSQPFQNFIVRFTAGETIFEEGQSGATMYIVQSGKVRLFRQAEGQKRPLGLMEKGDFFGEMSILEGLPRTLSAEAADDAELVEINSMIFDKMIRGNIEIAIRMLRKLSIRLREAERRLAEQQPGSARPTAAPVALPAQTVAGVPCIGVRLEAESGLALPLVEPETLIGRFDPVTELRPDIDLTDLDLRRSVSRRHARIVRAGEGYMVLEEVGALNGTFVNGIKLVPGQGHPLGNGDRLSVGTVNMVFRT